MGECGDPSTTSTNAVTILEERCLLACTDILEATVTRGPVSDAMRNDKIKCFCSSHLIFKIHT